MSAPLGNVHNEFFEDVIRSKYDKKAKLLRVFNHDKPPYRIEIDLHGERRIVYVEGLEVRQV